MFLTSDTPLLLVIIALGFVRVCVDFLFSFHGATEKRACFVFVAICVQALAAYLSSVLSADWPTVVAWPLYYATG